MTAFDWAAIIGAAAWVPQIIGWLYQAFTGPRLRVIPSEAPEIGYTSYGPIFNLTCAISVSRKDAIIERLVARLRHERGQVIELHWSTLDEALSQVRGADGFAEVSKHQAAIALKVSTLLLTEKKIGIQDPTFFSDAQQFLMEFHAHLNQVRRVNGNLNEVLLSRQFRDLVAYGMERFPWQQGRYTVELEFRMVGLRRPTIERLSFVLTQAQIETLHQNLELLRDVLAEIILPPPAPVIHQWFWVYPRFERRTN